MQSYQKLRLFSNFQSRESLCPKPKLGGGAKGEGLEIFGTTSRPEV